MGTNINSLETIYNSLFKVVTVAEYKGFITPALPLDRLNRVLEKY